MAKLSVHARSQDRGFRVEVKIRGHKIVSDLTQDKGGQDSGPTPPELLLGSLAACSAIFARMFAQREGLSGPVEVQAEAELADQPMVIRDFRVRVHIPGLPPEKRPKAQAFVEHCVVSQTLCAANTVDLVVE